MQSLPKAVIDVGTNSVKLLVAEVSNQTVKPLLEESKQTRLGQGFYETHRLQSEAIARTAEAVRQFALRASEFQPASIRVIATSAARDASNQAELIEAITAACDLKVEVISGAQEANWVYAGVTTDERLAGKALLILDIGGGSTEFILGEDSVQHFRESFRLGTVRLLEQLAVSDPPTEQDQLSCQAWLRTFLDQEIRPILQPALQRHLSRPVCLVSTGGTATILARMHLRTESFDRQQLDAAQLKFADILRQRELLWSLPLAERKKIVGLPPNRADVILAGAAILAEVMRFFQLESVQVSTRGLRFAALLDAS